MVSFFKHSIFVFLLLPSFLIGQSWEILDLVPMPERVSNNAVVEGFVNGVPYVYSFSGIDSTKIFSGIHLKSWRCNTQTGIWESIPPLPDINGKIAAGASRIGKIIYIIGGYSVFSNGNEISSDKVHRYDITNNMYLEDGTPLPVATDDHVQTVWRDSLIYVITGWSNTTNIPNVQIYNPISNSWTTGTSIPNNHNYKSFGASGVIVNDTIFYFGGAAATFPVNNPFPIQNTLRKGIINPDAPEQVEWSETIFANNVVGYRMGATTVFNTVHWLGGSETTYNFDGIAYNGSGGVPPANRNIFFNPQTNNWELEFYDFIPMDLRGVASINDTLKYIAGGMDNNQQITNRFLKLTRQGMTTAVTPAITDNTSIRLFPNPADEEVHIKLSSDVNLPFYIEIYTAHGNLVHSVEYNNNNISIKTSQFPIGAYFLRLVSPNEEFETAFSILR